MSVSIPVLLPTLQSLVSHGQLSTPSQWRSTLTIPSAPDYLGPATRGSQGKDGLNLERSIQV